jgi:hypothetical protein
MKPRRLLLLAAAAAGAALAVDFYRPARTSLYAFDGHEVARLETEMWRSYYDKRRLALFVDLAATLRTQYGQSWTRSYVTAYHAARAAFVFKEGRSRTDYVRALPGLEAYYRAILPAGANVRRVAERELEWWILHRERAGEALERGLADLQAEIYHLPAERLTEHARLRAEAMRLRDAGGDWSRIRGLLDGSWTSLSAEINRTSRR